MSNPATEKTGDRMNKSLAGFRERLRQLAEGRSINKFAADVGLGDNLVRNYLSGATPGLDKVMRICEAEVVSIDWLANGTASTHSVSTRGHASVTSDVEVEPLLKRRIFLIQNAPNKAAAHSCKLQAWGYAAALMSLGLISEQRLFDFEAAAELAAIGRQDSTDGGPAAPSNDLNGTPAPLVEEHASSDRTLEQVKAEFRDQGVCVAKWAMERGINPDVVTDLLRGKTKGKRGFAHDAAVALGMKQGVKRPVKAKIGAGT